jgi:hypothetical protein
MGLQVAGGTRVAAPPLHHGERLGLLEHREPRRRVAHVEVAGQQRRIGRVGLVGDEVGQFLGLHAVRDQRAGQRRARGAAGVHVAVEHLHRIGHPGDLDRGVERALVGQAVEPGAGLPREGLGLVRQDREAAGDGQAAAHQMEAQLALAPGARSGGLAVGRQVAALQRRGTDDQVRIAGGLDGAPGGVAELFLEDDDVRRPARLAQIGQPPADLGQLGVAVAPRRPGQALDVVGQHVQPQVGGAPVGGVGNPRRRRPAATGQPRDRRAGAARQQRQRHQGAGGRSQTL